MLASRSRLAVIIASAALAASACSKLPGGVPGRNSKVDPNSCGNYAVTDVGRKLHAFLEATVQLETAATEVESIVNTSCVMMGKELSMPDSDLKGSTDAVCTKVIDYLKGSLTANFKAGAKLNIQYKPAVCTVNVQAAAEAAASCEGKATADIQAQCTGTCNGKCNGTCEGQAGTGGNSGDCAGQCNGTCEGSCDGTADVNASAQCKAKAEVTASVDVQCTDPELTVEADAGIMVDTDRAEATLRAIRVGMPKLLSVQVRVRPLKTAFVAWAASARALGQSAGDVAGSFKDQALCITGQIKGAVEAIGHIEASISVSVSVSASASGAVGTN